MKTAGEVLGELFIGLVRKLTPQEREDLLVKKKLQGKYIQLILPDEHEAIVLHFEEIEGRPWLSYKIYSTPKIICRDCGWQGTWDILNAHEEPMDLTGKVSELDLFRPVKKTVIEKCIDCNSSNLKYKDWTHENVALIIKGVFSDIGSVAEIQLGGFLHKFKQFFSVLWLLMRKRVVIKPLRKLGTALKVSKLITGKVSADYKED